MKTTLKLLAGFLVTVCAVGYAQVAPEATGPSASRVSDKLQYALRYAETGQFSTVLSNWQTSTVSGSLDFTNSNLHLPFHMEYGGGFTWTLTGPNYDGGQFHRMFLSQGVDSHKWKLVLSDDADYLPESPTTGFSGIPGTGEPIGGTNPSPSTTQTILNVDTHTVSNTTLGLVTYSPSVATNMIFGGGYSLLDFPNNDGLNTDSLTANAEFVRHLNGRNAVTGAYDFSRFTYPGSTNTFSTNAVLAGAQRQWTRNLSTSVAAGPIWITGSGTTAVPNSTNISANASVTYLLKFASANATYSRAINGGAGYLVGAQYDTLSGGLSREFGRTFTLGLTGGFARTADLNNAGTTDGTFGGAETTWRVSRTIIVFANYTGTNQTSTSLLPGNALNQLLQVIGFGVGFSPQQAPQR